MNIQHLIEDLTKVVILQNDRIRNATDYISKVNTLTTYDQILDYKVYCERMLSMIAYNMYPTLTCNQKQQLLHFFNHQKEECDKALQRLAQDALKDKLISKLAERRTNNINWITNRMGYIRILAQQQGATLEYVGYALCFLVLVIFTIIFTVTYAKRLLYIVFFSIISP